MTLFLDNDVPESIVPALLHLGHEVIRLIELAGDEGLADNINFA